jgi:hypothetical protein
LDVGETFGSEKVIGDILGRNADTGDFRQSDGGRLGRRLLR